MVSSCEKNRIQNAGLLTSVIVLICLLFRILLMQRKHKWECAKGSFKSSSSDFIVPWLTLISPLFCDLFHVFTVVCFKAQMVRGLGCSYPLKSWAAFNFMHLVWCWHRLSRSSFRPEKSWKETEEKSLDWISIFLLRCVQFCSVGCSGAFPPSSAGGSLCLSTGCRAPNFKGKPQLVSHSLRDTSVVARDREREAEINTKIDG